MSSSMKFLVLLGLAARVAIAASCTDCLPGQYFDNTNACATCNPGYFCPGMCNATTPCPRGTFKNSGGGNTIASCTECSPGEYGATFAATSCTQCPAGSYCPNGNMTAPVQCAAGNYSNHGAFGCIECPAGYRCSQGGITLCTNGTYSITGSTACTKCPAGYECPDPGIDPSECAAGTAAAPGSMICSGCADGYYSNTTGSSTCLPCPEGHSCSNAVLDPMPCQKGKFSPGAQKLCDSCTEGFYTDTKGTISCDVCPAGKSCYNAAATPVDCETGQFSPSGATNCTSCATGFRSTVGKDGCVACPPGYECSAPSLGPQPCSAGQYSRGGNVSQCIDCPAGFFCASTTAMPQACPQGSFSAGGQINCTVCWAGYTCADPTQPVLCTSGKFSYLGDGFCRNCPAGFKCPSQTLGPVACEEGFYQNSQDQTSCQVCPAGNECVNKALAPSGCANGFYSLGANMTCTQCPAGFQCNDKTIAPVQCATGEYSLVGATVCITCPAGKACQTKDAAPTTCIAGTFSDPGATVCTPCPPGYHCPSTQSSSMTKCWPGSYSIEGESGCTVCQAGMECPKTDQAIVRNCPSGYYSSANSTACTPCPAGQACPNKNGASISDCTAGYYSTGGTTTCTMCPAGYGCPKSDVSLRKSCEPGTYSIGGQSNCTVCPIGSQCPDTDRSDTIAVCGSGTYSLGGQALCSRCPNGFKCTVDGTITACLPGTYTDAPSTQCVECPAAHECPTTYNPPKRCREGFYSNGNATSCTLCPAGYECSDGVMKTCGFGYHSADGATSCSPCPGGYACNGTELTTASLSNRLCPRGAYCPYGGWDDNLQMGCWKGICACPIGYYNPNNGGKTKADCQLCPAGYYCEERGTVVPVQCGKGHFCPKGTRIRYTNPCPAGTYGNSVGMIHVAQCIVCPSGQFCKEGYAGGDAYNQCPAGYYCPTGTADPFDHPCPAGTYSGNESMIVASQCQACPIGHYCPQASNTPRGCPVGTYNEHTNVPSALGCIDSPPGYFSPNEGVSDLALLMSNHPCPTGHFCPSRTVYGTDNPCPPGTYSLNGTMYTSLSNCLECPAGFWCGWKATALDGINPYQPCSEGHYCPAGSKISNRYPCPKGQYYPYNNGTLLSQCMTCPPGKYCEGGKGHISGSCAPGYYCPASTHNNLANPCSHGTYWPHTNGTTQSDCLVCPVGKYCLQGTHTPYNCSDGTYNNQLGATYEGDRYDNTSHPWCTSCPAGYYCHFASPTGTVNPSMCSAGTYSRLGDSVCRECPVGYYCDEDYMTEDDMLAKKCHKGYHCPAGLTTEPQTVCIPGTYCPQATREMILCPPGTHNTLSNQSECATCPQGNYCVEGAINPTGVCEPGYYCPAGSSGARDTPCPNGTYLNQTGAFAETQCKPCYKGYHCPSASVMPTTCPMGHYCPDNSEYATPCPIGTFSNATGLVTASNCTLCYGGSYCDSLGLTQVSGMCASGHFCTLGATSRKPIDGVTGGICPKGNYCPEGTHIPVQCTPGTYNYLNGTKTVAACRPCPAGYYCGSYAAVTWSGCCEAGWYCTGGADTPRQFHAPVGHFSTSCAEDPTPCPLGTYNDQLNQSTCAPCPAGSYCPEMGMSDLSNFACPKGSYCPSGVRIGELCPVGTFSNTTGRTTVDTCTSCTPGYYCETNGLRAPNGLCNAGYYCKNGSFDPTPTIQSFGGQCPIGHYCPAGSDEGIPCPIGTYRPTTLAARITDCLPCSPGWACTVPGLTSPNRICGAGYYCGANASSINPINSGTNGLCPTGHFCPNATSTPIPCTDGTYSDVAGLWECKECPSGKYCTAGDTSATTPADCPRGYYCNNGTKAATQSPCPPGTFGNTTGMDSLASCHECTASWYCDTYGAQAPTAQCDSGYYCPVGSQDSHGKTQNAINSICPAGTYCPGATAQPINCPPGTYSNSTGDVDGTKCLNCPQGEYCASSGLSKPTAKCSDGYYCSGNSTTPNPTDGVTGDICPVGHACPSGAFQPIPCEAGNYTNVTGRAECNLCPAGYFCPQQASAIIECPKGYYCPVGTRSHNEHPCPAGKYNPLDGRSHINDCQPCPGGQYCATAGLSNGTGICDGGFYCTQGAISSSPNETGIGGQCTPGHHCPPGSSQQVPCLGGRFCQDFGLSSPSGMCYAGSYCPSGAVVPTGITCTGGHYCGNGTRDPEPCHLGTYSPATGAKDISTCQLCPSGSFCNNTGIAQVSESHACTEGYYCMNGTVTPTLECPVGHRCPVGTAAPVPCSPGTYQNEGKKGACKSCQAGSYCEGWGNQVMQDCIAGHYCKENTSLSTQYPCPVGTFSNRTQLSNSSECLPCVGGSFCASTGLTEPTGQCSAGYYCLQGASISTPIDGVTGALCSEGSYCVQGSVVPTGCSAGFYAVGEGNDDSGDCTACPRGRYCAQSGASQLSSNNSGLCSPGYLCFGGSSSATPNNQYGRPCSPGTYCVEGALQEQNCSRGTYNPDNGRGECYNCTEGYVCDEIGMINTVGKDCPIGHYCPTGTIHPRPCPVGRYSQATGNAKPDDCTLCPDGKYCDQQNLTIPGTGFCHIGYSCNSGAIEPAPNGTVYQLGGGGWEGNGPCPKGNYCPPGTSAPVPCQIGEYNPLLGQTNISSCVPCPEGTYCANSGLGEPTGNCTAGYFCPTSSSSPTTHRCPLGKYCPTGSALPVNCAGGTYADELQLVLCKDCPAQFYCPANSTNKIQCPVRSYCPNNTELHITCPNGTYGDSPGLSNVNECQACPPGHYCIGGEISGNCSAGYICYSNNMVATPTSAETPEIRGKPCPKGHYCSSGAVSEIACPITTYRNETLGQAVEDCVDCPAGRRCASGSAEPQPCPLGHYCPFKTEPIICPTRTYRPIFNASSLSDCWTCPKGYLCNAEGISALHPYVCPVKSYCTAGVNESIPCPAGTFQATTGAGSPNECTSCPGGFYCPDATESPLSCWDGTYCPGNSTFPTPCPGGYYCPPKTENAILCPAGWYCPANSTVPLYCELGTYCDPGTVFPVPCGNGTRSLDVVNRTSFAVACADCLPGSWQNNDTAMTCLTCDPGYICSGGASDPSPDYAFQGGYKCPVGHYCPQGATDKIACGAGYHNPLEGSSDPSACVACAAGKYQPLTGQSGCLSCSSSSISEAAAKTCDCIGRHRTFREMYDASCICIGGYTYTTATGKDGSKDDSIEDCELIVYDRCGPGESRKANGGCASANYDCTDTEDCGTAGGIYSATLGVCQCNDVPSLDDICDSTCRASKPIIKLVSHTVVVYNSSLEGVPMCEVPLSSLSGFKDYSDCTGTCSLYSSETTSSGIAGTYSLPDTFKFKLQESGLCPQISALSMSWMSRRVQTMSMPVVAVTPGVDSVNSLTSFNPDDYPVMNSHGRRLLDASSVATASISPALYCLIVGEGVMFTGIAGSYPTFIQNLHSEPATYAGAEFEEMNTIMQANSSSVQMFAYTFREAGTFVFRPSDAASGDGTRDTYYRVLSTDLQCPEESRILPFTIENLNALGITKDNNLLLTPDWGLIGTMAGLFLAIFLGLIYGAYHFKSSTWGASGQGDPGYRRRAKNDGLGLWNFNSKGTVVQEENKSKGLRDVGELNVDNGKAKVVAEPQKQPAAPPVTTQPKKTTSGYETLGGSESDLVKPKTTAGAGKVSGNPGKPYMYEWQDQVSTEDFDFHSLYKQLELSREHFSRHFKDQEDDLRGFYKQMSEETDHLKSILAVKMNVQLKTSGEGFGEAVHRLVTAEINARKSFQWRFNNLRAQLWQVVTGDMSNAINTIRKDDYTITAVRNQCRIVQQQILHLFREIEQERTRRRGFGAHVEVVGVPIIKALTDLDFMEKKVQDLLSIKLNAFSFGINDTLKRIAKLDEQFAAVKKATANTPGAEQKMFREQAKQHLKMIKKAKVIGNKCVKLRDDLSALKGSLDNSIKDATDQHDYVSNILLSEREAEVADKSTNLFRGINPDMAKVLTGLLGMKGGFVYDEKSQNLQRAEPFDPTDPFAGIVDSSLDSEAKVLRGHLDKVKLEMQEHDEENEKAIKDLKDKIEKLKEEHERTKKELIEKARKEAAEAAEAKTRAEMLANRNNFVPGSIPAAGNDVPGARKDAKEDEKSTAKQEEKKIEEIDMDQKIHEAEDDEEARRNAERLEKIKKLQELYEKQKADRLKLERKNAEKLKNLQKEADNEDLQLKKLISGNGNDEASIAIMKEHEVELGLNDAKDGAEARRRKLEAFRKKRKEMREKRLRDAEKKMTDAEKKARDVEKSSAGKLKTQKVLNNLENGAEVTTRDDTDVDDNNADKLQEEYEKKMQGLLDCSEAEKEALRRKLLAEAKARMSDENAINGLIGMADRDRNAERERLSAAKKKQMERIKARMREKMAAAKAKALKSKEEKLKEVGDNEEAKKEVEKEADDSVLREQIRLLQEQLEAEKKLQQKFKEQMKEFNKKVDSKINDCVDDVSGVLKEEAKKEKEIVDKIEDAFTKKVEMAKKNVDAAIDSAEREKLQAEFDAMVEKMRIKAESEKKRLLGELHKGNDQAANQRNGDHMKDMLAKARLDRDKNAQTMKTEAAAKRARMQQMLRRRREALKRKFEKSKQTEGDRLEMLEEANKIKTEELQQDKQIRKELAKEMKKVTEGTADSLGEKKEKAKEKIKEWTDQLEEGADANVGAPVDSKTSNIEDIKDSDELRRRIQELEDEAKRREEASTKESNAEKAKNEVNNLLENFTSSRDNERNKLNAQRKAAMERMMARKKKMRERMKKRNANSKDVASDERGQIEEALSHFKDDEKKEHAKEIIETVFRPRFKKQRLELVQKTQAALKDMKDGGDVSVTEVLQQQAKDFGDMKGKQDNQVKEEFKRIFPNAAFDGEEWKSKGSELELKVMSNMSEEAAKRMQEIKQQEEKQKKQMEEMIRREKERAKKRMEMLMTDAHKQIADQKKEYMKRMNDGKKMSDMIVDQYRSDEKMLNEAILLEQERQIQALAKELENRRKRITNKKRLKDHMQFLSKSSEQDAVVRSAASKWASRGGGGDDDVIVLTDYSMEQFKSEYGGKVKPHELEIFKKLKNIEDLMKQYRKSTKDWQRGRFLDKKDREVYTMSSELREPEVCEVEDLTSREIMLYRFGLSLVNVLYKMGLAWVDEEDKPAGGADDEDGDEKRQQKSGALNEPPLLLLASELPHNPFQTAYKNSFWYQHSREPVPDYPEEEEEHTLFIRRERLQDVGEFILVLVHTTAHILSKHWEDRHPQFLQLFHRLLQFCCADLFFTRAQNSFKEGLENEVGEVVALKMQMHGNVGDMSEVQLQQRMRKYMLFTHSEAIQNHLEGISRHRNTAEKSEEKAKKHSAKDLGSSSQQLEDLADELDQTMCSIVMEMFRVTSEIKKKEATETAGAVSGPAGTLTVKDLHMQLKKLEAQKNDIAKKLEQVNVEIENKK